jgi:hypothetical protein
MAYQTLKRFSKSICQIYFPRRHPYSSSAPYGGTFPSGEGMRLRRETIIYGQKEKDCHCIFIKKLYNQKKIIMGECAYGYDLSK